MAEASYDGPVRRWLIVALWVAGTVAASSLAFVAVAMVGDAAGQPSAVLAPVAAADELPGEVVLAEGTVAVDCPEADVASLSWAQPSGGSDVDVIASGPPEVVVAFTTSEEVVRVEVGCVGGVLQPPTVSRRPAEDPASTSSTTSTTEPDDDVAGTSSTSPSSTTSTVEGDDDGDDDSTSTTEPHDDDEEDDDPDDH